LTSGWESPYFSELHSSFCQVGPDDLTRIRLLGFGIEVAMVAERLGKVCFGEEMGRKTYARRAEIGLLARS
jgi:hypothetical protein